MTFTATYLLKESRQNATKRQAVTMQPKKIPDNIFILARSGLCKLGFSAALIPGQNSAPHWSTPLVKFPVRDDGGIIVVVVHSDIDVVGSGSVMDNTIFWSRVLMGTVGIIIELLT